MAFFRFADEVERDPEDVAQEYRSALPPDPSKGVLSDIYQVGNVGIEQLGQMGGALLEYGAEKLGAPEAAANMREEVAKSKAETQQRLEEEMTPEGSRAFQAPFMAQEEGGPSMWDDPARSIGYKAVSMIPTMLASIVPGAALGRVGLAIAGGVLGAAETADAVNGEIDGLSDEELYKGSKAYRTLLDDGVDPEEARLQIKTMVKDESLGLAALIHAGLNQFGAEALAAKFLSGKAIGKAGEGFIKTGLKQGAEGFVSEGLEGGIPAVAQEIAGQEGGKEFSWFDVANQMLEEGTLGGVFSGTGGAIAGLGGRRRGAGGTEVENVGAGNQPDAATAGALQNSTGATAPPPPPATGEQIEPIVRKPPQGPGTGGNEVRTPPPGAKEERQQRVYPKDPEAAKTGRTVLKMPTVGPDVTEAAVVEGATRGTAAQEYLKQQKEAAAAPVAPTVAATPAPGVPTTPLPSTPTAAAANAPQPAVPSVEAAQPAPPAPPAPPVPAGPALPEFKDKGPPVVGAPAATGDLAALTAPVTGPRVLPDLSAEAKRTQELSQREKAAATGEGRGKRYEPGDTSRKGIMAWRLKKLNEFKKLGEKASDIAKAVAAIKGERGKKFSDKQHADLRELYDRDTTAKPAQEVTQRVTEEETKEEKPVTSRKEYALPEETGEAKTVRSPEAYVREATRAAGRTKSGAEPSVNRRVGKLLRTLHQAPQTAEMKAAIEAHPVVKAARAAVNKPATSKEVQDYLKAEREQTEGTVEEIAGQQLRELRAEASKSKATEVDRLRLRALERELEKKYGKDGLERIRKLSHAATQDIESQAKKKGGTGQVEVAAPAEQSEAEFEKQTEEQKVEGEARHVTREAEKEGIAEVKAAENEIPAAQEKQVMADMGKEAAEAEIDRRAKKPEPVKKIEISEEMRAKYNVPGRKVEAKAETKPEPKAEVTQRVTAPEVKKAPAKEPAAPKPDKAEALKAANKARQEARQKAINEAGVELLQLRQAAREAARSGDAGLQTMLDAVSNARGKIQQKFGAKALADVDKQVNAVLKGTGQKFGKRMGALKDVVTDVGSDAEVAEIFRKLKELSGKNAQKQPPLMDVANPQPKKVHMEVNQKVGRGPAIPITTRHTTDINGLFDHMDIQNFDDYARNFLVDEKAGNVWSALTKELLPKIRGRVGSVPVHVISDADWARLGYPDWAAGVHDSETKSIVLKESTWNHPESRVQTGLHEAVHSAFVNVVETTPRVEKVVWRMIDEVKAIIGNESEDIQEDMAYGLQNPHEFIAEAFSNPIFQQVLAQIPMTKQMAAQLNMKNWHGKSVWQGFVDLVRRTLGFMKPGEYSMLEGIIHAVDTPTGNVAAELTPDTDPFGLKDPFLLDLKQYRGASEHDTLFWSQTPVREKMANAVREAGRDTGKLRALGLKWKTLHQKTQAADAHWPKGMALPVYNVTEQTRIRKNELISEGNEEAVHQMHQLQQKYPEQFMELAEVGHAATQAEVDPSKPLSDKANKHVTDNHKWDMARLVHAEIYPRFQKLPQELKDVWAAGQKHTGDRQNMIAERLLDNIIEMATGRADKALAQRVMNNTITEDDAATFVTNKVLDAFHGVTEMKRIQGSYVPLMRRGEHGVSARYKLPKWEKFRDKSADTEERKYATYNFQDEGQYRQFIKDMHERGLHVNISSTVVDENGNTHYTDKDPATGETIKDKHGNTKFFRFREGDPDTFTNFKVDVQDHLVEFHESARAASQSRDALRADPNYTEASLFKREDLHFDNAKGTSLQLRHAMNSLEQQEGYKNLSPQQKEAVKQTVMELSLNFLSSTAPQNRARPRRNVAGFSKELVRNFAQYNSSTASTIARLENMPKLNKAFEELKTYEKRNKYDDSSQARSQIIQSMYEDAYAQDIRPTKQNRLVNALLSLSFLDKLASVSHHAINSLQTWMVALPYMAGKHGYARTSAALGRAYRDMGFGQILGAGLSNTKKAITDALDGTNDYVGDINKRLAKVKDGAELKTMLNELVQNGLIDKDAGLEIAELLDAPSKPEQLLRRVDHVVRQFGNAIETINRVSTAIAAYRMERERGVTPEAARFYAQETVANTQGNYSMTNAPKYFKHPLARIAFQFKKYAQLQYYVLSKLTYNAFKGATPQQKWQAAKSLTGLLAAHVAMAGAVGLPTEPIKYPWMLLSFFLPMPKWEEIEQGATEYAQAFLGENLGDAVTHGLPRLAGIDLSSRVGLNSLAGPFGEPRSDKQNDIKGYLFDFMMGAPGGLVSDWFKAAYNVSEGEYSKAAEKIIPVKTLSDSIKAYRDATEGTLAADKIAPAITRILGFKTAAEARGQEKTSAFFRAKAGRTDARRAAIDAFFAKSPGWRAQIIKYNKGVPADARITAKDLSALGRRKQTEKKKGYIKKGIFGGKINKDLMEKYL